MKAEMIRIVVVDDQHLMRDGLVSLLTREPDLQVVGEASNGKEAVDLVMAVRPDVVLMDIRMPIMNGIEATHHIISQRVQCKILMLTTFDDDDYIADAIRHGAVGYLLKDTPSDELANTIRQAARGTYSFGAQIGAKLAQLLQEQAATASKSSAPPTALSAREVEVLLLVAQGFSNREIAAELFITEGTVKSHLSSILAELQVRDRAQLIILAYEKGWVSPR